MVQAVIPTTVTGLQGRPIGTAVPAAGQALAWNGTAWAPAGPFLPIAGGTLTGALTIAAGSTANRVFNIQGVIDASNPPAGMVGEYAQGNGGPYTIANGTWASPVSMLLQPGDFDVWGLMNFTPGAGDVSQFLVAVSPNANTFGPSTATFSGSAMGSSALPAPLTRFNLAAATTIYLNGYCFSNGGNSCQFAGAIYARRCR